MFRFGRRAIARFCGRKGSSSKSRIKNPHPTLPHRPNFGSTSGNQERVTHDEINLEGRAEPEVLNSGLANDGVLLGRGVPERQEFFPGLPNDLVLRHVASRLSWNALLALTGVNRSWRTSIRSREIHQLKKDLTTSESGSGSGPRVSSMVQSLLVIYAGTDRRLALYDMERHEIYLLPPYPPLFMTFAKRKKSIVVMDGKIFVLGEFFESSKRSYTDGRSIETVLVLDVMACKLVWTRSSSTRVCTFSDICVPCNGKLFIFNISGKETSAEVFDPVSDKWNHISRMPYPGSHKIVALNKDIFFFSWSRNKFSAIYDTETKKWQALETADSVSFRNGLWYPFQFCVKDGKLYKFFPTSVEMYNVESNSWTHFQFIYDPCASDEAEYLRAKHVMPFDREVLAMLYHRRDEEVVLHQSCGFGVEGQPLVWQKVPPTFPKVGALFEDLVEF